MNLEKSEQIEFLKAAASVYAWVCASDGEVNYLEHNAFSGCLSELNYINDITKSDFDEAYQEVEQAFSNRFEDGITSATLRIGAFRGDPKAADLIRVARKALVSDYDLAEVEENVLAEICKLLDLKEENIP